MRINELEFTPHPSGLGGSKASHTFDNGFGVSVITGKAWYTSEGHPYEIAIINKDGDIDYTTHITDDVLGYLTEEEANSVLLLVENLEPSE